jgi:methylmalonyl-CoA mutase cobalamin-binding domain/chain
MTAGDLTDLGRSVLHGEVEHARDLTAATLESGTPPERVLSQHLIPAMDLAGSRFESREFFLPDLLLAARAMHASLSLLTPLLARREVQPVGKVVIGTVAGDLHDIGKNIVAAMLEGGGFAVHDLGYDVAPAAFADAARQHSADIVALSALLTTSRPVMQSVITTLESAGLRDSVAVLVGGAPLTAALAQEIGADAYAPTGSAAVRVARRLLAGRGPTRRSTSASDLVAAPARPIPSPRTSAPVPRSAAAPTSRELVKQTLEFRKPAYLPRQLWLLPWAQQHHPEAVQRIEHDFPPDIVTVPMFCSEPVPGQGNAHSVGTFVDAWGCTFHNLQDGIIGEVKQPLVTDWAETAHVRFPRQKLAIDRQQIAAFCRATDQYVLAGTCPRPFERLQFLRGTENLYLDLARPSDQLRNFIERLHAFYVEELTAWAATDVDGLTFMDDWGSQQAVLISPDLWRELFKPLYAEYVSIAHAHGKHAFMHSDGYIVDFIPDLIEIGLDALNSQVFCMDVEELGSEFGGRITFWGELDRQHLLPHASPDLIMAAAGRLKKAFHHDGGFIAQCEFGPGARPENVHAFFAALSGELN